MRRYVILGLTALAIGAFVVGYAHVGGPGARFLRGHVGDVAAAMLVYALISLARPQATRRVRGITTFGICLAVECGQLVWHARSGIGALLVGASFDPIDIAAYAVGAAIGVAVSPRRPPTSG